jgi:hypothetical protein
MKYFSGSGVTRFIVASVQHLPIGKFRERIYRRVMVKKYCGVR